jgi:hypothetical protein
LPAKNVNKSSNYDAPKALTPQLATFVYDFNDHKQKFEPRITRISQTPNIRCTKHGSKKKVVNTHVQTKLVKKGKK